MMFDHFRDLRVLQDDSFSISIIEILRLLVNILCTLVLRLKLFEALFIERRTDITDRLEFLVECFADLISILSTSTFFISLSIFSFRSVSHLADKSPEISSELQFNTKMIFKNVPCRLFFLIYASIDTNIYRNYLPFNISKKLLLIHFSINFCGLER